MAALLRQGPWRIAGSVVQRTQVAAVAEERRRLVPRSITTDARAPEEITRDIKRKQQELADAIAEGRRTLMASTNWRHQDQRPSKKEVLEMKEELYEALSKGGNLRNRGLLQVLALHVNPRPEDRQWSRMMVARRITDFVEASGTGVFVSLVVLNGLYYWIFEPRMKQAEMERENHLKQVAVAWENYMKQVAEGENQVETD